MKQNDPADELDIVQAVLERISARAQVSPEVVQQVDQEVRLLYGGLRVRVPKRGKWMSPDRRKEAYADALTNMPTPEVLRKHKISLATLKRLVKKGPGT